MAKNKNDVDGADADEDRVARFNLERLLEIADEYAKDKQREGEFSTTWFAQQKGWTYDRAIKVLRRMEADGMVTSRKAGPTTWWTIL